MKNVLLITPFFLPNIGGAETYAYELTEYLRKNGYFVNVLTYQPITTAKARGKYIEKKENITIRRFQWIGFNLFNKLEKKPFINFLYLTPYLLIRSFIWMLFNHKKVDVIDAQGFNSAFVAVVLKKIFNKKAVVSVMSLYDFDPKSRISKLVKWIISNLDHVIVESEVSKRELVSIGVPGEKVKPYIEWLDLEMFKPYDKTEMKKEFGWPDKFTVIFVGRALEIKGIDLIIDAAKRLNNKPIQFVFIANSGPLMEELEKISKEYENIIFIPGVLYSELPKYESGADLAVVPSKYSENSAITVLTAICCGTPVVASNMGAIPDLVTDEVSLVVKPTSKEFEEAILKCYNDRELYKRLQSNCRFYAEKNFGVNNASTISNVYEKVLKKNDLCK